VSTATLARPSAPDLVEVSSNGEMTYNFHAGQGRAWQSTKRDILLLGGTQSGKTAFGPLWLHREIQMRGPGDYMVVTPTFPLLELKALPEFRKLFENTLQLGRYVGSPSRRFIFSEDGCRRTFGSYDARQPTQVLFGHAQDSESLESATAKAAWLDEAGQKKFKLGSDEAIRRRLSIAEGRRLYTTTPYDLGWLKQRLYDPWQRAKREGRAHPTIDVVQFDSTTNPRFSRAEFERARDELPPWKFDLFYRAIFTRPAGMIYDTFDTEKHTCKRFDIPEDWPRFMGVDFGPVHTAAVFIAQKPNTQKMYVYREYLHGRITTAQHAAALLKGEPLDAANRTRIPMTYGGSSSEGEWRWEFGAAGLPITKPDVSDVEVGITRVYGAMRRDELIVFDDCEGLLAEIGSYSRQVDDSGEPLEAIEDKHSFHRIDALRYVVSTLRNAPLSGADRVRPVSRSGKLMPAALARFEAEQEARKQRGTGIPQSWSVRRR
jgi:hypothetical protein